MLENCVVMGGTKGRDIVSGLMSPKLQKTLRGLYQQTWTREWMGKKAKSAIPVIFGEELWKGDDGL